MILDKDKPQPAKQDRNSLSMYYILKGKEIIPCNDIKIWAATCAKNDIAKTQIFDSFVSTIFLGINHNFDDTKKPLLFETMIFGGERDGLQERFTTYDEALNRHNEIVSELKSKLNIFQKIVYLIQNFTAISR